MGSETRHAQEMLAGLGGLLARRAVIIGCALAWIAGTIAIAVVLSLDAVTVLTFLIMGMIMVGLLQSRRQHLAVTFQMGRQAEVAGSAVSRMSRDVGEVLDRLKLTALSLGRLSEDLAQATVSVRRVVAREGEDIYRQLEALQNLYAMIPVEGRIPSLRGRATPGLVLAQVEMLRVEGPRLVVECGSGASTLWCALAIRHFGIDSRIVALDDNSASADETRILLGAHGVEDLAEVRHAPLEPMAIAGHMASWYSRAAWADLEQIGLLLLGAPATAENPAGLPALALLGEQLADKGVVLLNECGGSGEEELEHWLAAAPAIFEECRKLHAGALVLRRAPAGAALANFLSPRIQPKL